MSGNFAYGKPITAYNLNLTHQTFMHEIFSDITNINYFYIKKNYTWFYNKIHC